MKKIGFIGVGVMGKSMVRNLMKNGFEVTIYTRTKSKVEDVISEGAIWCDDVAACSKGQDAIITIVGYPKDIDEVYFGEEGILNSAKSGAYVIDMTTTSPKQSISIYNKAKEKGLFALDAPVSGGDVGAKNGTLSIMVGGDKEAFEACKPIFKSLGKNIIYEGAAGAGQHTKMANQIAIAGAIAGVVEAMSYAKSVGLDVQTMLDSISQGAAGSWQMTNMAPRILKGDLDPGFFLKHFIKDMGIAVDEADDVELNLEVLKNVLNMYKKLEEQGLGDLGTQALIKYYER
ncbi:NAD(P)-dependent oxidoreductase [Desulfuribacillus alkaliarsenatis]|uniref:Oxidoreductase n=1 Tax=Desulfuribacillus alkaliarsenatis TaxID=766136 RepID=A0A1E5G2B6_9FIRM|nr:NAD(P)-dependent oxidoreductase [Desulfuribacillus alkaliarsenatis]OEF97106.1 oxidoreductase [Desulfuribacillus alkaliarsenatis]